MTAPDRPASRLVDERPPGRDPAARAAMLEQLREYHRLEAEAEDAVDRAVVADLHAVLTERTAPVSAGPPGY